MLGHKAWEQHGFWPTFRCLSDFHFLRVGLANGSWDATCWREAVEQFLSFADELSRRRPVELMFMYCNFCLLDPDMMQGLANQGVRTTLIVDANIPKIQISGCNPTPWLPLILMQRSNNEQPLSKKVAFNLAKLCMLSHWLTARFGLAEEPVGVGRQ